MIVALCCCAFIRGGGGKASGYTRKRRIRIRLGSWSHGDEEYEVDNAGGEDGGGGDGGDGGE